MELAVHEMPSTGHDHVWGGVFEIREEGEPPRAIRRSDHVLTESIYETWLFTSHCCCLSVQKVLVGVSGNAPVLLYRFHPLRFVQKRDAFFATLRTQPVEFQGVTSEQVDLNTPSHRA